jgi:hypothetical protein
MTKTLLAAAAALAILAATGCCWPIREGRYRQSDRWSESTRPPPPERAPRDRWRR